MSEILLTSADAGAQATIPVHPVSPTGLEARLAAIGSAAAAAQVAAHEFKAGAGDLLVIRNGAGEPERLLFGMGEAEPANPTLFRALSAKAPTGLYRIEDLPAGISHAAVAAAFAMGGYVFDRYRRGAGRAQPRLIVEAQDLAEARRIAHATALARDMVNTPANDMGPLQIETVAREIAEAYSAKITVVTGDALLEAGYPAVHAVGRAATVERAPRMIELTWGEAGPLLAICGKGVVFDTGGLDIKPAAGMRFMKKDMGGAAHALALGRMIMDAGLPVRLVVLVPAVENAISADAVRPGDIIATRKGLSVEIGNTDAEGRLILADALARAAELEPELTIDLATLTGAARVALGPQVIPFYTDSAALADEVAVAAAEVADPLWRMPLWQGYAEATESDIADLRNDGDPWAQAGSIMAALFLQRFAPAKNWMHFDIFAWNPKARAGWPAGAEAQAIRALFAMLTRRYA